MGTDNSITSSATTVTQMGKMCDIIEFTRGESLCTLNRGVMEGL